MSFSCVIISKADGVDKKPSVELTTNDVNIVAPGDKTSLKLIGKNFNSVKGMDVTVTIPIGVTLDVDVEKSIFTENCTDKSISFIENKDYTLTQSTADTEGKFRFISAFVINPISAFEICFKNVKGNDIKEYKFTTEVKLADNDEKYLTVDTDYTLTQGKLIVGKSKKEENVSKDDMSDLIDKIAEEEFFIPVGSLYSVTDDGSYAYPEKNSNGKFVLTDGSKYTYTKFKKPSTAIGVTTFSQSCKKANVNSTIEYEKKNGIQFASYVLDNTKQYGTIVVKGNFEEFCKDKNTTKQDALKKFSTIIPKDDTWYNLSYGDNNKIYIARIPQRKYMWSGDNEMQYALRVYNISDDSTFTTVGYSKNTTNDTDEYTLSSEIQSGKYKDSTPTI